MLKPGDAAGFKANSGNGHQLVNRTARDAVYLEIGTRAKPNASTMRMSIMLMVRDDNGARYTHKNGEHYE